MDGVILFADNNVFQPNTFENDLFTKLNNNPLHPVLPISSLETLERTFHSISTFRAIVLDWNFNPDSSEDGVKIPPKTPKDLLTESEVYSLIFIYSRTPIGDDTKEELTLKYGSKIEFLLKDQESNVENDNSRLLKKIEKFEADNKHLHAPFLWSKVINKSVQSIFKELENADPNWIKEIYNTAKADHAEPNTEVINIFQNLLNESIIQETSLTSSLAVTAQLGNVQVENKEQSLAKLYHRIYYTKLVHDAPIMTGDIFKFPNNEYAILITPECDIASKKDNSLEFLKFYQDAFVNFLITKKKYSKINFSQLKGKNNPKELNAIKKIFNNGEINYHILPSFPFDNDSYNTAAFISFESAFIIKNKEEFENNRINFKLNSPYIHQLRQRYLAYVGRFGVPAIPTSLQEYNLK